MLTYDEARTAALRFPDGRAPDLVHCFTPRELVRRPTVDIVRAHNCRYVVHLEDNEEAVVSGELRGIPFGVLRRLPRPLLDRALGSRRYHPVEGRRFLREAAGVTVIVERLREFVPAGVPSAVVGAGFDPVMLAPHRARDEVRAELELGPGDLMLAYPGPVHRVNLDDMRSLYAAVAAVRGDGLPVTLVKTGLDATEPGDLPALGAGLLDLGWVPRAVVPELLDAADILVQPGRPGPYNDYRFPSKLPEFLVSGRPVVLPRANVGLQLRDGEEALVLRRGDAGEIQGAVGRLAADP